MTKKRTSKDTSMDSAMLNCQMSSWLGGSCRAHAYKTELVELPESFLSYLTADGVYVADSSKAMPARSAQVDSLDEDDYRDWSSDEEQDQASTCPDQRQHGPEVEAVLGQIEEAIRKLGGAVSPKLNWSCPSDAVWVTTSSTHRCTSADEVVLLLKSSDRASHDICHSLPRCRTLAGKDLPLVLALRKWHTLKPGREFRCFVRDHQLVGISQRDVREHFPGLDEERDSILEVMLEFFEEQLQDSFPEANYTFDVYLTSANKVKVIDFNVVGESTHPLLFTWEELNYQLGSPSEAGIPESDNQDTLPASTGSSGSTQSAAVPSASSPVSRQAGNDTVAQPRQEEDPGMTSHRDPENGSAGQEAGSSAERRADGSAVPRGPDGTQGVENFAGVEFRVVMEPNRVQPNMPIFGVPYDLVDNSEGGAYSDLLQKLQEQQLRQDAEE